MVRHKNNGLSCSLKDPTGKGLIILQVGSTDGFVDVADLVFKSGGKNAECHQDMNGDNFERWFTAKLLPKLPPNSVIVMDNASYHFVQTERIPAKKTCKIDVLADENRHHVLRLPPYPCKLKPNEMIWAKIKSYYSSNDTTFKLDDVKILLMEAIDGVTAADWLKYINHVIKVEDEMIVLEGILDTVIEKFIIHLGDSDTDQSDSNASDWGESWDYDYDINTLGIQAFVD
ncbi:uncharacterized protein LOC141902148 [Tubulanus polymorphus]|uniref:uncharacterized protein LOC141902148 n=1 Tax=Tubulanus polymorphus TaxID=672921 RepID=UPI003DA418A6